MSTKQIETNNINGSWLAEQEPLSGKCSWQGNIGHHHANCVICEGRKWSSLKKKIAIEWFLLREPMVRGYRKGILSL